MLQCYKFFLTISIQAAISKIECLRTITLFSRILTIFKVSKQQMPAREAPKLTELKLLASEFLR